VEHVLQPELAAQEIGEGLASLGILEQCGIEGVGSNGVSDASAGLCGVLPSLSPERLTRQ
jgi:hypothetical protein